MPSPPPGGPVVLDEQQDGLTGTLENVRAAERKEALAGETNDEEF